MEFLNICLVEVSIFALLLKAYFILMACNVCENYGLHDLHLCQCQRKNMKHTIYCGIANEFLCRTLCSHHPVLVGTDWESDVGLRGLTSLAFQLNERLYIAPRSPRNTAA